MTDTDEAACQPQISMETNRNLVPPASPLYHFIRENCKNCPFTTNSLDKCDSEQQLKCILSRISLDLHSLVRNDLRRNKHLDW